MFAEAETHPMQHQSKNEAVKLTVAYGTHSITRYDAATGRMVRDQVKLRSYNGKLMGPLIERRPGDTLLVTVSNRLPAAEPFPDDHDGNHNGAHGLNTTNLHVHGLHVSPAGNSDNVLVQIRPGEHFHYEIKIPDDHEAGTFWYHAHKHGSTAVQVASGLAGPLIIRGKIDELPAIREATEHIFFFQEILYERGIADPENPSQRVNGLENPNDPFVPEFNERQGLRFSVNGVVEPTLQMRPGDVHRWRFIHAGVHDRLEVRLVSSQAPGRVLPQYQIAHDGITTGRLDRVEQTELYSGYRTDVLVHAVDGRGRPLAPGLYLLMDDRNPALAPERRVLARIQVMGRPVSKRLPTEDELRPLARPLLQVPDGPVAEQRVEFSSVLSPTGPVFRINGQPFNPCAPPYPLQLGQLNRWTIVSADKPIDGLPPLDHTFHIHVNPFQVESADGRHYWKDTIVVHPQQTLRLLTRYEQYIGVFPLHCHILFHEDHGMMQLLEVHEGESNHPSHPHGNP